MKKFLITGATGFVGSCIVRRLVESGEDVSIIVRNKELNWRIGDLKSKLHVYKSHLLDPNLDEVIADIQPTHIFHLAAYGSLPHESALEDLIDTNIKGTARLLQSVKRFPFQLFINTGSSSEYGSKSKAMDVSDSLEPINDYAVTKAAATLYCKKEAVLYNLPVITFRLFSAYGPYEQKSRFVPTVILNTLRNTPLHLNSPKNVRDFIFIDDLVDAYIKSIDATIQPGETFNIGSGIQHMTKDVVDEVIKLTQSTSEVHWGSFPKQERQQEPAMWQADISYTKEKLGWEPKNSLHQGLEKSVKWFSNHLSYYE